MVGLSGLEPPTSRLSGERSNQLSYRPLVTCAQRLELGCCATIAVQRTLCNEPGHRLNTACSCPGSPDATAPVQHDFMHTREQR